MLALHLKPGFILAGIPTYTDRCEWPKPKAVLNFLPGSFRLSSSVRLWFIPEAKDPSGSCSGIIPR
jgi:hypothetical protein